MDKKMMILVCFFSVATFISSTLASCFVFYNEKARTDINSNKVIATSDEYKSTSIIYNSSNIFNINNIEPGTTLNKTFSITNNNSNQIFYDIVWKNVSNNWNNDLVYSLSCTDGQKIVNEVMPKKDEGLIILENQELKTNKTNECTITATYIFTGLDQSYNLDKSFGGEFKVIIKE